MVRSMIVPIRPVDGSVANIAAIDLDGIRRENGINHDYEYEKQFMWNE